MGKEMLDQKTMDDLHSVRVLQSIRDIRPEYIRYEHGTYLFSVSRHTIMDLAEEAEAKIVIPQHRITLVDYEKLRDYIRSCAR